MPRTKISLSSNRSWTRYTSSELTVGWPLAGPTQDRSTQCNLSRDTTAHICRSVLAIPVHFGHYALPAVVGTACENR
jgi:hypothetical protein